MSKKKANGITLIALIITVIVMLILAGVAINLTVGENGIFKKSEQSRYIYEEQVAKERLEMAIGDLVISKYKDTNNYNEKEYIDTTLANQNITMIENIAIVDNWLFEIDRSVPRIVNSLGKKEESKGIKIQLNPSISNGYVKAILQVEITCEEELSEVTLKGENLDIPMPVDSVYRIEKEILENGTYTIIAKDKNGNFKIETIIITDITEDMEIWNKEDMKKFREKVEEGRTFEGKTVRVMADIDLEGTENNQWLPIGDETNNFAGIFEGNYHTISNLYINNSNDFQGLFGTISNATLKQIILDNVRVKGKKYIGGITGKIVNGRIEECGIDNSINSSVQGNDCAGGIAGVVEGSDITYCYNTAEIAVTTSEYVSFAGGVIGMAKGANISYCYNTNKVSIEANKFDSEVLGTRAGGVVGKIRQNSTMEYCYNIGDVSAKGAVLEPAGICSSKDSKIKSCFCLGKVLFIAAISNPTNRPGNISAFTANTTVSDCYCTQEAIIGFNYTGNTITNNKLATGTTIKSQAVSILGGNTDIWIQLDEYNKGYPILQWELKKN